jgi:hypothetical protein
VLLLGSEMFLAAITAWAQRAHTKDHASAEAIQILFFTISTYLCIYTEYMFQHEELVTCYVFLITLCKNRGVLHAAMKPTNRLLPQAAAEVSHASTKQNTYATN